MVSMGPHHQGGEEEEEERKEGQGDAACRQEHTP